MNHSHTGTLLFPVYRTPVCQISLDICILLLLLLLAHIQNGDGLDSDLTTQISAVTTKTTAMMAI